MHIRTMPHDTAFARRQVRTISRAIDHLAFITENERDNFERLGGHAPGTVVYNIAGVSDRLPPPHADIPSDERLRIACISNYSWARGLDRLIEVAEALAGLGRRGNEIGRASCRERVCQYV